MLWKRNRLPPIYLALQTTAIIWKDSKDKEQRTEGVENIWLHFSAVPLSTLQENQGASACLKHTRKAGSGMHFPALQTGNLKVTGFLKILFITATQKWSNKFKKSIKNYKILLKDSKENLGVIPCYWRGEQF